MFEYLMPLLFARDFTNSLLHRACVGAVGHQMEYGRRLKIPWGISESAHGGVDAHRIYQVSAFGLRELALNPDAGKDAVVAPYPTILALTLAPGEAVANLQRLAGAGMSGPMGLYESLDFRSGTRAGEPVCCYMAHHQAMSLAALANVLHRGAMQRRFRRDPRIRSIEPLLCERIPMAPMPSDDKDLWRTAVRAVAGFRFDEQRFTRSATTPG